MKFKGLLVSDDWRSSYSIKWTAERKFTDFNNIILENFNFSDGKDDSIYIYKIENLKIKSEVFELENDEKIITFEASFDFDLDKNQLKLLKKAEDTVDYCLEFRDANGDAADSESDYEFLSNRSLSLSCEKVSD